MDSGAQQGRRPRIDDSLKTLNFSCGHGSVALFISDVWDRGRVVRLNPLLGLPDYVSLTHGIQAGLPYIHNLASLEGLAVRLLEPDRKSRRY
jgi:hypothetical protein